MTDALRAKLAAGAIWTLAALMLSSVAVAGERVQLEGAPVTVEVPDGWVIAPVSRDGGAYLQLTLCDPELSTANSCAMKGELSLEQLDGARAPASLDTVLSAAQNEYDNTAEAERLLAPRRLFVAGRHAVEEAGLGDIHYDYVGGGGESAKIAIHSLTLQDNQVFYRCMLSAPPSEYDDELSKALHEFCSSLQFSGSDSQSGQQ